MNKTPGTTYFAETDSRNKRTPFGIKKEDRSRHMYLIGKTGMGKSTVLENMAIQDIQNGNGLAFIDPHGKTADLFLEYIPEDRIKDVVYFAPFDIDYPISFNVMEDVGADKRHLVANGLMSAFKKIWVDAWSARMEYILNNTLLALLEYPDSTLIGVNRMFADKEYRKEVVSKVTDTSVKAFWNDEFAKYNDKYAQEATAAIQNKIGQFISNPLVRNIIGQPKSNLDLRKIMDERKILVINLSKGRLGEANANLLGSMIITKIYLAAMSRADRSEKELESLPNFYLYVDEFQNFANESFADILSEARKYKLNLTVAHQYIEQMSDEVRAAVFGNVGTMITFRVGAYDAEVLEKEFSPEFLIEDLVNLGKYQIYLKLMIDGATSSPFSGNTLPQIERPIVSYVDDIIKNSRKLYTKPREQVEQEIKEWHSPLKPVEKPRSDNREPRSDNRDSKPIERPNPRVETNIDRKPPKVETVPVNPKNEWRRDKPNQQSSPQHSSSHQPFKHALGTNPHEKIDLEQEAKEAELRKAMSLNFLKPVESERKKQDINKKKPTPENVSALKDALMSVIGEVKENKVKEVEPVPEVVPLVETKEVNKEVVKEIKKEEVVVEAKKPEEVKKLETPPSLKEIPEEELRRMLEV